MDYLTIPVLEQIAKHGRAYTNESRAMALELLEVRAKEETLKVTEQHQTTFPFIYP